MTRPASVPPMLSETWRGLLSLALVFHLGVIGCGLAGNLVSSPLVSRINRVLSPYGQTLNVVPRRAALQLTHATVEDDDHRLEVATPDDRRRLVIPLGEPRGSFQRARAQAFAQLVARYVAADEPQAVDYLIQAIGAHGIEVLGAERVVVRSLRLEPQPIEISQPFQPGATETVYEADVLRTADGQVIPVRRSPEGEVSRSTLRQE